MFFLLKQITAPRDCAYAWKEILEVPLFAHARFCVVMKSSGYAVCSLRSSGGANGLIHAHDC